jgi:hypothetical protein
MQPERSSQPLTMPPKPSTSTTRSLHPSQPRKPPLHPKTKPHPYPSLAIGSLQVRFGFNMRDCNPFLIILWLIVGRQPSLFLIWIRILGLSHSFLPIGIGLQLLLLLLRIVVIPAFEPLFSGICSPAASGLSLHILTFIYRCHIGGIIHCTLTFISRWLVGFPACCWFLFPILLSSSVLFPFFPFRYIYKLPLPGVVISPPLPGKL